MDGHRIPLLAAITPAGFQTESQAAFKQVVLWDAQQNLAENEVAVHDAGASVADVPASATPRFALRLARNCTARRHQLPDNQRGGSPLGAAEYGRLVRPLAGQHKGHTLPATLPDVETEFTHEGRTLLV